MDAIRNDVRSRLIQEQRDTSQIPSADEVGDLSSRGSKAERYVCLMLQIQKRVEDKVNEEMARISAECEQSSACAQQNILSLEENQRHLEQQQEETERIASEMKQLRQKIKGMEKKLLKGEKKGGIAAVASMKEQKLHKNQQRLQRKCVRSHKKKQMALDAPQITE